MSQNNITTQLIRDTDSCGHSHCVFIIASPQIKLYKKLKPYMTQHCGPDFIALLVTLSSYKSEHLIRLTGHLLAFQRSCQQSSTAIRHCYRPKLCPLNRPGAA